MLDKDANIISQIDQRPWHVFTCHDCASAYKKSPPNSRILPLVSGCIPKWSLGTSNPNQKLSFPLDSFFVREMHFADLFFTDLFFKVRDWILVWFRGVNGVDGGSKKLEIKRDDLPRTWGIWLTNPTPSEKDASLNHDSAESSRCAMIYMFNHILKSKAWKEPTRMWKFPLQTCTTTNVHRCEDPNLYSIGANCLFSLGWNPGSPVSITLADWNIMKIYRKPPFGHPLKPLCLIGWTKTGGMSYRRATLPKLTVQWATLLSWVHLQPQTWDVHTLNLNKFHFIMFYFILIHLNSSFRVFPQKNDRVSQLHGPSDIFRRPRRFPAVNRSASASPSCRKSVKPWGSCDSMRIHNVPCDKLR